MKMTIDAGTPFLNSVVYNYLKEKAGEKIAERFRKKTMKDDEENAPENVPSLAQMLDDFNSMNNNGEEDLTMKAKKRKAEQKEGDMVPMKKAKLQTSKIVVQR